MDKKEVKLSGRQEMFIEYYLAHPNATEAAKKAGYSVKTAYSQGQRLLKNVEIQKRITGRVEGAVISANEILEGVKDIALSRSEKTSDRLKAYELLGKHLAMWVDNQKVEHDGKIEIEYVNDWRS